MKFQIDKILYLKKGILRNRLRPGNIFLPRTLYVSTTREWMCGGIFGYIKTHFTARPLETYPAK